MHALPALSLYIHIPWCVRKCPYCDFNSHHAPVSLPQDAYVDALLRDLDQELPLARGREIQTIFFGGGTPSLFAPDAIARILDGVAARLSVANDVETTLETNPGTVEHGDFSAYRSAGVNRLSFGVQSFDDDALKRIGRIHDANQAVRAIERAQDAGLENINIDLMYALPGQSVAGALDDVDKATLLKTPHLSHYQLTLEPNTSFASNPPALPDEDSAWDMQEACQARMAQAGFLQYEVSAYARPGGACRHNLNYWRFGDYLGIGAGAHAKLSRWDDTNLVVSRRWKLRSPNGYLQHAGTLRGIGGDTRVVSEQLPFEYMLNALRLSEFIPLVDFYTTTGLTFGQLEENLHHGAHRGWLEVFDDGFRTTALGQRFLNDVIGSFLQTKD